MSSKGLASSRDQITTSSLIQAYLPNKHLVGQSPYIYKGQFQQEINKMLQAEVLVPVHEPTPWISSFVLAESRDKLGNLQAVHLLGSNQSEQGHSKRALSL